MFILVLFVHYFIQLGVNCKNINKINHTAPKCKTFTNLNVRFFTNELLTINTCSV